MSYVIPIHADCLERCYFNQRCAHGVCNLAGTKKPVATRPEELRNEIIEECARAIESQKLVDPAQAAGNKWGAAGLMQTICAAAVRALLTRSPQRENNG